ncbi:MAG: molecular chaperone DnaK [bacterium]
MSKILGIDLGTTFSAGAVMEGNAPKIIENAEGARTTPSIVATTKTGEKLVGLLARRQAVTNPKNTIFQVKRFMGHQYSDAGVQKDKASVSFDLSKSPNGGVEVAMGDKKYRPEEISAMIIQKIKNDAETKLGEKINDAVITVPAYFDDSQRQATKDAGQIAGLNVLRIINEPTAAALAYGLNKKINEKIAVYDFGGGTFDVSILEIGDSVIEVRSTDGDSHLGGRDIDKKIVDFIAEQFMKENGIDLRKDSLSLQRLDEAAEKAKIELSTVLETEINIPFVTSDASGPKHLLIKLSRANLENLTKEFIDRSMIIAKRALSASPFKVEEIDEIIMVGGQTRMPAVINAVKTLFGKEPNLSVNPDEVVALGAAVQGGILRGDVKDVLLLDVIPLALGIETMGGVATHLVEKNTTIPTSRSQIFSTAADNQTSVEIHIVQGERPIASDNKSLGRFILDGIPPALRGMPQVEVTFDIDANGILNVKAKDKTTNKEQSIRIEASSGLKKEEIERMTKEAEINAEEDKKKKEIIEVKNIAEQIIYTAEKAIKENGAKITPEIIKGVEDKISALKTATTGTDIDIIKKATDELSNEMQKIGEAMAKANSAEEQKEEQKEGQTQQTASEQTEGTEEKKEDIKDAEFKETSDGK